MTDNRVYKTVIRFGSIAAFAALIFPMTLNKYGFLQIYQVALIVLLVLIAELRYKPIISMLSGYSLCSIPLSVLPAVWCTFQLYPYSDIIISHANTSNKRVLIILFVFLFSVLLNPAVNILIRFVLALIDVRNISVKKSVNTFILTSSVFFIFYIYLPFDTYFNNISDFKFLITDFAGKRILCFLIASIVISVPVIILKEKVYNVIFAAFSGIAVCMYLQYMFLNRNLRLLDGETVILNEWSAFSVITLVLWLLILCGFILFSLKKEQLYKKIRVKIPFFLSLLQLVSVAVLIAVSGNRGFVQKDAEYLSGDDQYIVGAEENVIVFVLDAVDNNYIKDIMENKPDLFTGFEDFTLYTNTCSVFDSTPTSMTQMFTGMDFSPELSGTEWYETAWNSDKSTEFFGRLHDAGYVINGYSMEADSAAHFKGKFDNYCFSDDIERMVNKDKINEYFDILSLYRILPYALKKNADINSIDFNSTVSYLNDAAYKNQEFFEKCELDLDENSKKYFTVQHLFGAHPPCSDFVGETEYLISSIGEYIHQLKELGVYDNSAIIITADHGEHNDYNPEQAGTPVFMIKNKNVHKSEMTVSMAPVYHEDIQATILDCADLYKADSDNSLFGRSVFDIPENENRTRTWYDRRYDSKYNEVSKLNSVSWAWGGCNVYYGYTYAGDTETLNKIVSEGRPTEIFQMTDNKG